jgi:hypothetical protein
MQRIFLTLITVGFCLFHSTAQDWPQRVKYRMDVNMDVSTNVLKGKQQIEYTNTSPDTLKVLFFHMYWNAFQPNSMMDVRSRELGKKVINGMNDWDFRVTDRISKLTPDETGYQKINSLRINGKAQTLELYETILKVTLDKPLLPKSKLLMETDFEARVPVQIRRSGRENAEGVKFSMAQWYPKLVEYDGKGWNTSPYVGREFYGVWGDFDVNITIDRNYIIAGTGYLQNANEIGYGYEAKGARVSRPAGNTLTWKFTAPNVHDFVWAADPDFRHESRPIRDGLTMHVFYKISPMHLQKVFSQMSAQSKSVYNNNAGLFIRNYEYEWQQVLDNVQKAMPYIEKSFGKYPYKQFSFIQGGDGGMEYPMATLLKGAGESVVFHEFLHSWFPMIMSNNEALEPWMDEGFATYSENRVLAWMRGDTTGAQQDAIDGYVRLAKSGFEEPLTTHADHYNTKYGYTNSSYNKGAVFYEQLGYIIGANNLDRTFSEMMRRYRFRHVVSGDFLRVAEGVSGMQLDWYRQFFVNTTRTTDYGIDSLWQEGSRIKVRLRNKGTMPMPIDLVLQFKDGSRQLAYVPLSLSFGNKPVEDTTMKRSIQQPWPWTSPTYVVELDGSLLNLKLVEIDPTGRMADVERKDNKLEIQW